MISSAAAARRAACFVLALDSPKKPLPEGVKALMLMNDIRQDAELSVRPAEWIQ